ncbi:MAG: hypothetical protein RLN81_06225 [Balneolaceae bacterium]
MRYRNIRNQNLLIIALFLFGLSSVIYIIPKFEIDPLLNREKLLIEEAVLSHLFKNNASGGSGIAAYYFIRDSPDILNKFKDHIPIVESESNSKLTDDFNSVVLHRDNGKDGIIFTVHDMDRKLNGQVYVIATYYVASLNGGSYEYLLEKINGEWVVLSSNMKWIS